MNVVSNQNTTGTCSQFYKQFLDRNVNAIVLDPLGKKIYIYIYSSINEKGL